MIPKGLKLAKGMVEAITAQDRLKPLGEAATAEFWCEGAPDVAQVEDLTYVGAAGQEQAARLYRGRLDATAPVLLFIHGGGWTGGSIALHEPASRALAAQSGCAVLSISYRLSPAHPYPAGLDDCCAAASWLALHGPDLGLDPTRVIIGGASAGANLALSAALRLPNHFIGTLLFYGVFGQSFDTESYRTHAEGPGLTKARMQDLFAMYDPEKKRLNDPLVAPLNADLSSLPPSCLIAAGIDVLRSENEAMADRLDALGLLKTYHLEPGVTHGFINRGRLVPAAQDCLSLGASFLSDMMQKDTL